jgi:polyferredoxin
MIMRFPGKYRMLRQIRIIAGILILITVLFYIILPGTIVEESTVLRIVSSAGIFISKIQFFPSVVSGLSGYVIGIILCAGILISVFLFGRIYCSTICPLGIMQDFFRFTGRMIRKRKTPLMKKGRIVWYLIAVAAVVSSVAGFISFVGFIDPWSLFGKIAVYGVKPGLIALLNMFGKIQINDEYLFPSVKNHTYHEVITIIAGVVIILFAVVSGLKGRIWCNYICPVGALFGIVSRFSVFKISFNPNCNACGRCAQSCRGGCMNVQERKIDNDRCVVCFDCVVVCDRDGIGYERSSLIVSEKRDGDTEAFSATRKEILKLGVVSLTAMIPFFAKPRILFADDFYSETRFPVPPGARDIHRYANRCTGCGLCVSKCPTGVLRASLLERGIGGLMQPVLDYGRNYCQYECTICSQICPTGALRKITQEEKKKLSIGTVRFVKARCIVETNKTACGACAEVCPTHAVTMVDYKNGLTIPETDESICIGCGACEFQCPVRPARAIYVMGREVHRKIESKKRILTGRPENKKKEEKRKDEFPF